MRVAISSSNIKFLLRVFSKAIVLLIVANLLFAIVFPTSIPGNLSLYNHLFQGRDRFPFGENPTKSYNLSLFNLDAMFSSHRVSAHPAPNEYRVFVIGDSSVWGTLLTPADTLTGQLNSKGLKTCDGRDIHFYNLGYPTLSLIKDLMVLSEAKKYQPDQIVWLFSEEAFPKDKQLSSPIVANNPDRITALVQHDGLEIDTSVLPQRSFWKKTIFGQRRALADLFRLQFYGVMWSATGIDQEYPEKYSPAQRDFDGMDILYHGKSSTEFTMNDLSFDVLEAGIREAGKIPMILVNEPIMISSGKGSDQRYNFFYPRWAYDDYRNWMEKLTSERAWKYIDAWNLVEENEYTNSAIHLTPTGENRLVEKILSEAVFPVCK
jgi:hypothetical protein